MRPILAFYVILLFSILLISQARAQSEDVVLNATDGSIVTIQRDSFGVPHISSETEAGVFFGQGFAVAQDRLFQLEQHRRAAEGKLGEWLGQFSLEMDRETRTMFYTYAERVRQFSELPSAIQIMLQSYSAGINAYIDSMKANPSKYQPIRLFDPPLPESWSVYSSLAISQFLMRIFGQAGGQELDRLSELQQKGQVQFDQDNPINDPGAPTTIHATGSVSPNRWRYSGMRVRTAVVDALDERRTVIKENSARIGLPLKFGSFATLITSSKSATGNVMLLGAPQMGAPNENATNITNEVELICPTFHVGGMTVAGLPSVIIGRTEYFAWSFTSGVSDNSDVYIDSTMDASYSQYFHNNEWVDFEVVEDTLFDGTTRVPFTHFRTVHGPVFGDDLANHQVYSMKMTFWNQETDMIEANYAWVKAKTLEEFEAAISMIPFSFNVFYAGKDQRVKFWHVGKYQDRRDGVDPRLPHKGDGSEEWRGFINFAELPSADGTDQDYFVNWNNKPVNWWNNGDNIPWAGSTNLTTRVSNIDEFVGPINSFSYANLKDVPLQINDHGTYQQAIELSTTEVIDENIIPPGQSAFVNLSGERSPHISDQWPLHINWQFKDMIFAEDIVSSVNSDELVPRGFVLHQNYPNPFNPGTTISYDLPEPGRVLLEVYNIQGQLVETLVNEFQEAGTRKIAWDASGVSSGVYLYRMTVGKIIAIKKGILLK